MKRSIPFLLLTAAIAGAQSFDVEPMPNPPGVDPQIGGLDVRPDGKLAAAFHRGEVMIFDPATKSWSRFAEGLHEPLGLLCEGNDSVLVMQRAELTRIKDVDGDGSADTYETVFDDFGMSGNYHEFAFGPARGPDGSLYIGLNVASNGAGIRPEIRGEWSDIGDATFEQMIQGPNFGKVRGKAGRMYARVAYRGWIIKLSPDGSKWEPFASGFRSPDGIGFDAQGRLLVDDNQGDWRGTSPLYVVEKGGFYGHPASLVWTEGWDKGDPRKLPVEELDAMRTKPAARFPQGELANSPTQPIAIPDSWGPYGGQTLIGEMNQPWLVRYLADEVGGVTQGSLTAMFNDTDLGKGNHRLAFSKDGTLWVGKTHLSWAGAEGLVKITPKDIDKAFAVTAVELEKTPKGCGFRVSFSQPIGELDGIKMNRFDYKYHQAYGSPKVDEAALTPAEIANGTDNILLELTAEQAKEGAVHCIEFSGGTSKTGSKLGPTKLYYQATKLP
ncbi:large multi-functional protein [Haloferula helveola]|uniref:Large multi-functional protein n=1 Tax=Haloferula helveola TaxID=490095 RepID=A0ABN6H2B9_9BACT|nr:large multi-functional protein [Haloferula helveola]